MIYHIHCATTKFLGKQMHAKFTPKIISKQQTQVYLVEISSFASGSRQSM